MTTTLDDFGTDDETDENATDTQTEAEAATPHDAERTVEQRARFLERSTRLGDAEARTLAWSEAGYSHGGIAKKVGSTEGTVAERLDRVVARYGIEAAFGKQPDERGQTPLSPASPAQIAKFPDETLVEWRGLAEEYPEYAPEWVGTDRDPTTAVWERAKRRAERQRDREQGRGGGGE